MHFTYFLISWTFWIFPVKSQIYPKSLNHYERINNSPRTTMLKLEKNFPAPLKFYQDNNREFSMMKRVRNRLVKNKPSQRQRQVLYYPPPKTYHYPYADRFRNFYKNPGFHNYNYFNNYRDNNEKQKKIIPADVQLESENNINQVETRLVNFQKKPKENENFFTKNNFDFFGKNGNFHLKNKNSLPMNGKFFPHNENSLANINGHFFVKNGKLFYPRIPNSFMEPPGYATSDYRTYQKAEKNLKNIHNNELYKNHNIYKNHKMNDDDNVKNSDRAPYIRDHAPENNEELSEGENVANEENDEEFPKKITNVSGISPDGDRVEFQIQGHEGPRTYLFGYDTGEGSNRQYRLEEKLKDGTVKGQYGYYDARGKLRAIKYVAKPTEGYQEIHHSSPESTETNDIKENETEI